MRKKKTSCKEGKRQWERKMSPAAVVPSSGASMVTNGDIGAKN